MDQNGDELGVSLEAGALFEGEGELRALLRALDWSVTPIGPPERWPAALRTMLRVALDSPFPIALWCGAELVFLYNDAYRPILGGKHPAALGRPGPEVWREIWDEIAPHFERIRDGGAPVYLDDAPFVVEREGRALPAWFSFALSAVRDDAGEVVAFLNLVSETTGRISTERAIAGAREAAERAEARLREAFAQAPVFLAVLRGADHVFEFANDAYHRLVDHRDIVGKRVVDALPEMRGQGFVDLLDQVLSTGEPYVGREVAVRLARGEGEHAGFEERFLDFVYQPLRGGSGGFSGIVAVGTDVTEQVLARREIERAREAAESARRLAEAAREEADAANAAKSEFLATMSHEIRTPINAIQGYAQLIELGIGGPLTEQQRDFLSRLAGSADHLLRLINEVLDLSKIDAGGMVVAREEATTDGAIRAALEMTMPQAASKGVRLVEAGDAQEATYVGDEHRVGQILVNLIGNAIKFTEPGGLVTVRSGVAPDAPSTVSLRGRGPWAFVAVTDTGIGIARENLGRIFAPFQQVSGGRTRRAGGTGLGLTISRRLARVMGGEVTVESEPGEGSTFVLWLPTPASLAEALAAAESAAEPPFPSMRGARLVEVGEVLRDSLEDVLSVYVALLREDPALARTQELKHAELEDHALSLLGDFAQSLIIVGGGTEDPTAMLRDGSAIQRTIAEHHGIRRHAQGWSEKEVRRDHEAMRAALERVLRDQLATRGVNADEAVGLLTGLIGRVEAISRRAWRLAERTAT